MSDGLTTKRLTAPLSILGEGAPEGSVQAAFSIFDEIDTDGDVVLASAFTPGQEVPMASWGHDWGSLPVGKGTVRVEGNRAVFDGRFFVETSAGRDAYLTVKALGGLQEWSWGFRVLDAAPITIGGKGARAIKRAEVYEVSPVLLGANRNTETLAIKAGSPGTAAKALSFEDHTGAVQAALDDRFGVYGPWEECAWVQATYDDRVVFQRCGQLWQLTYTIDADGEVTLSDAAPIEVQREYVPAPADADDAAETAKSPRELAHLGKTYADHAARVLSDVEGFTRRSAELAALRAKAGRALSAANRQRLGTVREQLLAACDDIERLLGETEPTEAPETGDAGTSAGGKDLDGDVAAVKAAEDRSRRLASLLLRQRTLALAALPV